MITIKAAPKNTRERVSKHRAKLKEQGGKVVTLDLEAEELALIEHLKLQWGFPARASRGDVIKAMTVILSGHTLVMKGSRISATVKIEKAETDDDQP
ncbi:hypothetical protein [Cronobacter sakazakii]|uniref:hypothetical protein n=1 Tax=Cronobacter sakazakii TaxID=28141 RepID=UPI000F5CA94A|nr:hypothetical protein [Cronobacter sakazakii]EJJ0671699.1 hypothetical protein [Cronobacter sakazakii]KAB0901917.1 hypothetical protein FZI55_21170 [Cronobacter sakazakii]KAB0918319.1 hypothetical protein FZI09_22835 [Cronobacter sakazakii]KAB0935901.1 hypothetical protein FZH89_19525 [Cronobacter sakazakii]KAB0948739.1 hypothetical protein FZH91_20465 [Cronobacter sakazakii]